GEAVAVVVVRVVGGRLGVGPGGAVGGVPRERWPRLWWDASGCLPLGGGGAVGVDAVDVAESAVSAGDVGAAPDGGVCVLPAVVPAVAAPCAPAAVHRASSMRTPARMRRRARAVAAMWVPLVSAAMSRASALTCASSPG